MTNIDLAPSLALADTAEPAQGLFRQTLPNEPTEATAAAAAVLAPLMREPARPMTDANRQGPSVWRLLAVMDQGRIALVAPLDGAGELLACGSQRARTTVDLHGAHIGHDVLVVCEGGDPSRPIVTGVMRGQPGWPLAEPPAQVQVDADGQRLVVTAQQQLVLRCGKASITLTQAGKVLIEGSYVLSRSTGVNRVKGGSVQLN